METGKYTGIGLIGNEKISAIYAVNNGIVDINGTGIYHLFYNDYSHDLLHPYVKPTTKKYLFFLVPMIQLS